MKPQAPEPINHSPMRFTGEDIVAARASFEHHVPGGEVLRRDYDQTLLFRFDGKDHRFRIHGVLAGHRRREHAMRVMTDKAISHFTANIESQS